ncbi:MAG: hypothetical protein NTW67_05440 [Candidatus Woesearchaeota archaeon]|nr:hypothetical protein [Candidatus Woesearchaeota archaeon]
MTELTLQEIHEDLELIKHDMADLKAALLGDEGKLSDWAKERIESYLKKGAKGFVSQEQMEKDFC